MALHRMKRKDSYMETELILYEIGSQWNQIVFSYVIAYDLLNKTYKF